MQLVASVAVIVIGLLLGFFLRASGEMRIFGWILVGVGVLGLVARSWIARLRDDQSRQRRSE
jgi:hypothetical protein